MGQSKPKCETRSFGTDSRKGDTPDEVARICAIHPGDDSVVRAVTIQCHGSSRKQVGNVNLRSLPVGPPNDQAVESSETSLAAKRKQPASSPDPGL